MKKKLLKIYKGSDYSHVNNNKSVFYSFKEEKIDFNNIESKNIEYEYIINTPVTIETYSNEIIHSKIVSKLKDHILTSNNRIIKLKDIKSIKTLNL